MGKREEKADREGEIRSGVGKREAKGRQEEVTYQVREAFKSNFWKNLGIWPNQVDPPSPKVETAKTKKKLMFIWHFRLF